MDNLPTIEERLDFMVTILAQRFAKQRTRGNVYMDGSHNPTPTEIREAEKFIYQIKYILNDDTFIKFCHPELNYHSSPHNGCILR